MRRKIFENLMQEIFFLKETLNLQMKLIKTKLIISIKNFLWLKDFGSQRAFTEEKKYFV